MGYSVENEDTPAKQIRLCNSQAIVLVPRKSTKHIECSTKDTKTVVYTNTLQQSGSPNVYAIWRFHCMSSSSIHSTYMQRCCSAPTH
jgi:hypothetical protein